MAPVHVESGSGHLITSTQPDFLHRPAVRKVLPFVNGGLAGVMASCVIQPVDMIKVRIQLAGEGTKSLAGGAKVTPLSVARDIVSQGKVLDLYSGLSAAVLRQVVYTTARMGFFGTFMESFQAKAKEENRKVTFGERAGASLAAGGLGALLGNPADLSLIRMQSDGLRPIEKRENYRSVFDALKRISRNEGVLALWGGATPTVIRAMALNFGQLAFYSETKAQLQQNTNLAAPVQFFVSSCVAGFAASAFSLPFDFIKTRLQRQTRDVNGRLPYKNMMDCALKVVREEGVLRFYRGFGTYFIRIAPHAMMTLLFADALGILTK
ncbi:putative mitochondrial 2-oxoglutarate/malate carrier protein [Arthrobotrys musiformis]|uniref:Mitochondrial 2-oxoglutarate/malate carrier protein n=1 Tax=Arthrobotrys musiformis TaxID=47236 RepID=A0AAV9W8L4_9PEZI